MLHPYNRAHTAPSIVSCLKELRTMLSIRPAHARDVPTLNTLIHEFAEFERLPVAVTEASSVARWIWRASQIPRVHGGMGRPARRLCCCSSTTTPASRAAPVSFSRTSTFATNTGERELARPCWRASPPSRTRTEWFWRALAGTGLEYSRHRFLQEPGCNFLDDWKTVSLDGDALEHVARSAQ